MIEVFRNLYNMNEYFYAIGIFIILFLLMIFFRVFVYMIAKKIVKKTKFGYDDAILKFLDGIGWPFYLYLSLYIVINLVSVPLVVGKIIDSLLIVFIGYYVAKGLGRVVDYVIKKKIDKKEDKKGVSLVKIFGIMIKFCIWLIIFLMVLTNYGVEITPLIASLGVASIAIALALQSVLGDLFSAFVIYFDKPFVEGDFIIVGEDMGVVKNIGIKTTRIEALGGQEISVPNHDLTGTRINNYKKMQERRVLFNFGVVYKTPTKKLEKIKNIVKGVIDSVEGIRFDRVHFKKFGDYSLDYEVVYYVLSNDYNKYMDTQEKINLGIKKEFEKEKINFAYPTSDVFVHKS